MDAVVDHFGRLVAAISASVMDGILIAPAGASQAEPCASPSARSLSIDSCHVCCTRIRMIHVSCAQARLDGLVLISEGEENWIGHSTACADARSSM